MTSRPQRILTPTSIVGLDFETYFDKDYTLKKLSTSEYIRDPRFEPQMVGLSRGPDEVPDVILKEDIPDALADIDWAQTAVLCHHTHFDGLILTEHYGATPCFYFDTLSMSRGWFGKSMRHSLDELAERMGHGRKMRGVLDQMKGKHLEDMSDELIAQGKLYCARDVNLMWLCFMDLLPAYPVNELDIIDQTVRMFCEPRIEVDLELAHKEFQREQTHKATILSELQERFDIHSVEGVRSRLASTPQFAAWLESLDVEVPYKEGKPTPDGEPRYIPALAKTDLPFIELQEHSNPLVRTLCEARLAIKSTIVESRAQRLIDHALPALPVYYNYCGAHTFRHSGGDKLNPQNLPAGRKGQSDGLRRALKAPKGYVLVTVDSSQNEDRSNCWIAGQTNILELYANDGDPYSALAADIYGYAVSKKTHPGERGLGKTGRLGLGFGCGAVKFRHTVRVGALGPPIPDFTKEMSQTTVDIYRQTNERIVWFWSYLRARLNNMIKQDAYWSHEYTPKHWHTPIFCFHNDRVEMPNGLCIWYRGLEWEEDEKTGEANLKYQSTSKSRAKIYGGKMAENLVQSFGRSIVFEQQLEIAHTFDVVMTTHDEVTYLAKESEAEDALAEGIRIMSVAPDWCATLPVAAEGEFGRRYAK